MHMSSLENVVKTERNQAGRKKALLYMALALLLLVFQEGLVKVNGSVEKKRSRLLKPGDVVEFNDLKLKVVQLS